MTVEEFLAAHPCDPATARMLRRPRLIGGLAAVIGWVYRLFSKRR